jgi:hypothetical protein
MEKTDSTRHIAIIENCAMSALGYSIFCDARPEPLSAAPV